MRQPGWLALLPVNVLSTVPAYLGLASVPAGPERVRAWADRYEAAYPDVFSAYYRGFGSPEGRKEAAEHVDILAPEVGERCQRVRHLLDITQDEFVQRGLLAPDVVVSAVLLVGTSHSDAWVDVFRGVPTLFVALETLIDEVRSELLIVHEFVHVAQLLHQLPAFMARPGLRDTVGIRVWAEGLAVATSRIVRPGLGDLAYYSVDDAGWVQRCRAQQQVLARTIADNLTRTDPRLVYALCGVKTNETWPSRAGYWIGDMIVQEELSRGATIQDLLTWNPDRITEALRTSTALQHS